MAYEGRIFEVVVTDSRTQVQTMLIFAEFPENLRALRTCKPGGFTVLEGSKDIAVFVNEKAYADPSKQVAQCLLAAKLAFATKQAPRVLVYPKYFPGEPDYEFWREAARIFWSGYSADQDAGLVPYDQ